MSYQISFSGEARRQLRALPGRYRQRIRRLIDALEYEPRPAGAKELRDLPNVYRIRIDTWRLIYQVDDNTVTILVLGIRHKTGPETYQDLPK